LTLLEEQSNWWWGVHGETSIQRLETRGNKARRTGSSNLGFGLSLILRQHARLMAIRRHLPAETGKRDVNQ
jgi:hypothetical protein